LVSKDRRYLFVTPLFSGNKTETEIFIAYIFTNIFIDNKIYDLEAGLIWIGYLVVATVGETVAGQAEGHAKTTRRLPK
jgi:hypothetical protein